MASNRDPEPLLLLGVPDVHGVRLTTAAGLPPSTLSWRTWRPDPYVLLPEPFDPDAIRTRETISTQVASLLDAFASIDRAVPGWDPIGRAATLSRKWAERDEIGVPLTLCGVCGGFHRWDRVSPYPGGPSALRYGRWRTVHPGPARPGVEPLAEWSAWSVMVNALRRATVAIRDEVPLDPADVARFWPVALQADNPPAIATAEGPKLPTAAERMARVEALRLDPLAVRGQVVGVVNEWIRATCVSPAVAVPRDHPAAEPLRGVHRIGSLLALLGWALRRELVRPAGSVAVCPVCRVSFSKGHRRGNTAKRTTRTLCSMCDATRRQNESRLRRKELTDG